MPLRRLACTLAHVFAVVMVYAQCEHWDNRFGTAVGMSDSVLTLLSCDPDGDGPLDVQLIAGGTFEFAQGVPANGIARWDGVDWHPLDSGMDTGPASFTYVSELATWDSDGDGPAHECVVAAGRIELSPGLTVWKIALWDGSEWQTLGTGSTSSYVYALCSWDRDGEGPQAPVLVAGGDFTNAGGTLASRIAFWDGAAWSPLASGVSNTVRALTQWDLDGPGPNPPLLAVGGDFHTAGGVIVDRVALWDGQNWRACGSGADSTVHTLASWDIDQDGPALPVLIAGGHFDTAGGVPASSIAAWDGAIWTGLENGVHLDTFRGWVYDLATRDPDGFGPLGTELVVAGSFSTAGVTAAEDVATWNGNAWHSVSTGGADSIVRALAIHPSDADQALSRLFVGGAFVTFGGVVANYLVGIEESGIVRFGTGLTGSTPLNNIMTALEYDPDGSGPLPPQLIAGGTYLDVGTGPNHGVVMWDGQSWHALPMARDLEVFALSQWDFDGAGVGVPPALLAAGTIYIRNGSSWVNGIASWNGAEWQLFAPGLPTNATVYSLQRWDPDGAGPAAEMLAVGGLFGQVNGVAANGIVLWDGLNWQPLSTGVTGVTDSRVRALTVWDPDGTGPLHPNLVAGGRFITAGGVTVNHIARWDGTSWHALGSGVNGYVRALATWDPDGDGPQVPELIAGGEFTLAGGVPANNVARWDGAAWHPLGPGTGHDEVVRSLLSWDPDGIGPRSPWLVMGGTFQSIGAVSYGHVAAWDGTNWHDLGGGVSASGSTIVALTTYDHNHDDIDVPQLVVGGKFQVAGNISACDIALWSNSNPNLVQMPDDAGIREFDTVELTAAVDGGGHTSFQWYRDGIEVLEGPGGASEGGGIVAGASGAFAQRDPIRLLITETRVSDAGSYTVNVVNDCGEVWSEPARLTIVQLCPADLTTSSDPSDPTYGIPDGVLDTSDFFFYLDAFAAGNLEVADLTTSSDPNDPTYGVPDGVLDGSDFFYYLDLFAAGCP